MSNWSNKVLYVGVTNNIRTRAISHMGGFGSKFTTKYRVIKLVYFEIFDDVIEAIKREKQLKAGSRQKKITLINNLNPHWKDLALKIIF